MRHAHRRARCNSLIRRLLKIEHGRPKHDRHAHCAGLNQILSTRAAQGAAHHNHAGTAVVSKHFAHAVTDDDFCIGGNIDVASTRNAKAAFACSLDSRAPTLRMTRHNDGNRLLSQRMVAQRIEQ